jgi:site-specific DNA recombinase
MLRSRALLGETTYGDQVVRARDGSAVERGPALVTRAEWKALQEALDQRAAPERRRVQGVSLLLGFVFCGECGAGIHHQRYDRGTGPKSYYACRTQRLNHGCKMPRINGFELERLVVDGFLALAGPIEVVERRLVPGEDHSAELESVRETITELEEDRKAGLYNGSRAARYREMMAELLAKQERLEALPNRPDAFEYVGTGETFGQRWERLETTEERRAYLEATGVKAKLWAEPSRVAPLVPGFPVAEGSRVTIELPPDLAERVRKALAGPAPKLVRQKPRQGLSTR